MGDGRRLKEILDEKGTNVRQLSFITGIKASTLYSCIQKDSNIRFDNALRIANTLGIDPMEICSSSPFSGDLKEEEIYPTINDKLGILDKNRVSVYLKNSMKPLMELYGKNELPEVDKLLTYFYILNDESRKEVVDFLMFKLKSGKDLEREEAIKKIKTW